METNFIQITKIEFLMFNDFVEFYDHCNIVLFLSKLYNQVHTVNTDYTVTEYCLCIP